MAESSTNQSAAQAAQQGTSPAKERLILQDPIAWDQATQPNLRSSLELNINAISEMEREKARAQWDSLNLNADDAVERASERRRAQAKAEGLMREVTQAKNEVVAVKTQLNQAREDRFNHPIVYLGAASLLGLGCLWWLERRKRMRLEDNDLEAFASSYGLHQNASRTGRKNSLDDVLSSLPADLPTRTKSSISKGRPSAAAPEPATTRTPELVSKPLASQQHQPVKAHAANYQLDPVLEDSLLLAEDFASEMSGGIPAVPKELAVEAQLTAQGATAPQDSTQASAEYSASTTTPAWANPASATTEPGADAKPQHKRKTNLLSASKGVIRKLWPSMKQGARSDLESELDDLLSSFPEDSPSRPSKFSKSSGMPNTSGMGGSTLIELHQGESIQVLPDQMSQYALQQNWSAQQIQSDSSATENTHALQALQGPPSDEAIMEQLLELRTAVHGLVVLGRINGAQRLLEEHIALYPTSCAWTHLRYLQLCEQLEEREKFEAMRQRYRLQFNRMAPYWHEPNSDVLGLDGYARAANELCLAWSQGSAKAQSVISGWLIGSLSGRKMVQQPAYDDLLDLYEMLILSEQPGSATGAGAQSLYDSVDTTSAGLPNSPPQSVNAPRLIPHPSNSSEDDEDFVPTVSLLDLDYEFFTEVSLDENAEAQAERAAVIVKSGKFSVDFNVAHTQPGALSVPGALPSNTTPLAGTPSDRNARLSPRTGSQPTAPKS